MAAKFQNPPSKQQQTKIVVVQQKNKTMPQQQFQPQIGNKPVTVTSKANKTEETKY